MAILLLALTREIQRKMQQPYRVPSNRLASENGSILLNAIVTTIIIAIISGVILQQSLTTVRTLRAPRIKAAMTAAEGGLRQLFMQPATFTACNASGAGFSSCDTAPGVRVTVSGIESIPSLYEVIPGCTPAPCGVKVVKAFDWGAPAAAIATGTPIVVATPPATPPWPGWDPGNRTYAADIIYEGTETAIQPRRVVVVVPAEILQTASYVCPTNTPIFQGYNANGTPKCRSLTYSTGGDVECAAGFYVAGFNPGTMVVDCREIQSTPATCPTGYFNKFIWDGSSIDPGCYSPRPTPAVQYGP